MIKFELKFELEFRLFSNLFESNSKFIQAYFKPFFSVINVILAQALSSNKINKIGVGIIGIGAGA